MNKFKLTDNTVTVNGITLYRIEALKDFGTIKKGEVGGYLQSEDNLSQEGWCWVSGDARIFGKARVSEYASVSGEASVFGKASVSGDVRVSGKTWIFGEARIYGDARVSEEAKIFGHAWINGDASVFGNAQVSGNASVFGKASVYGRAVIYGEASVNGEASVYGNARIYGKAWSNGKASVRGDESIEPSLKDLNKNVQFSLTAKLAGVLCSIVTDERVNSQSAVEDNPQDTEFENHLEQVSLLEDILNKQFGDQK